MEGRKLGGKSYEGTGLRLTVKLSIMERLLLLHNLPKEGSYSTLKIMRKFREELSFSEMEHKALNLREEDDGNGGKILAWDPESIRVKPIEIGPTMLGLIKGTLERLSNQGKLNDDLIPLYERFVLGEEKG